MRKSAHRFVLTIAIGLAVLTTGARAADTMPSRDAPDLTAVRAMLKAKNYDGALRQLTPMQAKYDNADVHNLLAFSQRKTGDRVNAMANYKRALVLNANHKGALEYQGELYVELGQLDNARGNLAKLTKLCPSGCEELGDLKAAIDHAPKS